MSEVYSGLRQRRKRTHPSKCPCCRTDRETEPENDEVAGTENHNEASIEIRQSKRKRPAKEIDDAANSENESLDQSETTITTKPSSKKRKLRNISTEKEITVKKEPKANISKNKGKPTNQRKVTQTQNNKSKKNGNTTKNVANNNNKPSKITQQYSDEEEVIDSKNSKNKTSKESIKTRKATRSKAGKTKSVQSKSSNKEVQNDSETIEDKDDQNASKSSTSKKPVSKVTGKGKTTRRTPVEKPQQKGKGFKTTQLKLTVFDSLYNKLKERRKDISIEQAAEMLMKISSENLQNALLHGNDTRQEKKGISDTEEIVSQAAEALVSFRTKSPISRDEGRTDKTLIQVTSSFGSANPGERQKSTVTYATTVAQSQIRCTSSLPSKALPTSPTASTTPNMLHAMLPPVPLSQSFAQLLPPNLTTSFTNLMPMVSSHGTLPSFNQIAAQLRPSSVVNTLSGNQAIPGFNPPLMNQGLANTTLHSSLMLPNQPLIQPQLKQPLSLAMANKVTTIKPLTTTPSTTKTTATTVESTTSKTEGKQNPLPLKGMEEVIGNVGSNVPQPIVWNIKSPVVFLGSPQNLGGVPRNLVASPNTNQSCASLEQGGYLPVAPRPVSKSDALRASQGAVSSVQNMLTLGGRPILPRTQQGDESKRMAVPQSGLPLAPQYQTLNPSNPYQTTTTLQALTQVTSVNPKKTNLMSVNIPTSTLMGSFLQQNVHNNPPTDSLSPTTVSAKQAVKKLVHERTKSAELKKEGGGSSSMSHPTIKQRPILPLPPKEPSAVSVTTSESISRSSEFNLEQAATALLSIGVPDGIEIIGLKQSSSDPTKDDEDVVFTSKGMFRVGDVDVDPQYNRIGREGYTCGKCNKIFTSLSYLARHIKRVCPDMSCRKWKCTLCEKAFRHPFGLQQHVYTHTGERPHKCPLCPKAFYSSNDLRRHSRIHSGERPYRCKHCDKSFATTISLKTHTYIHTGEKPHKCPQCPKTFATSSKLGRHIVTHSEQRPFSCDQCPKSFNRSGDLRRHNLAVHDGKEKSFDCELCPATFSKSADLRRHNTTIHQKIVKTLECEDCGTQFTTPLCLKMHRDTYHKKTPTVDSDMVHTCDVCGKTYSNAILLTRHKATHERSSTAGYNPTQFQHIAPKPSEQATAEAGTG